LYGLGAAAMYSEQYLVALGLFLVSLIYAVSKILRSAALSTNQTKGQNIRARVVVLIIAGLVFVLSVGWIYITRRRLETKATSIASMAPPFKHQEARLSVRIGPAINIPLVYSVLDTGSGSKCSEPTSQFFWVGLRNDSDRSVGIDKVTVEAKLKGASAAWIGANTVIPTDSTYIIVPDFGGKGYKPGADRLVKGIESFPHKPVKGFLATPFVFPSLIRKLKDTIKPGDELFGWIMSKPLGEGPTPQELWKRTYQIAAARVTVQDNTGLSHTETLEYADKTSPSSDDVPKGSTFTHGPPDKNTFARLSALETCK
jgi:hypothetical protein